MNVSVIIATYGSDEWARKAAYVALPSALGQGAHEVVLEHLTGGTLAQARNLAAERAQGDWLCFLDADDELDSGYLAAMQGRGGDELELLAPRVSYVDEGKIPAPPRSLVGRPLIEINCAVIGTLVSRGLFAAAGGFRERALYEDWDLWLTCEELGARVVEVPEAVYVAHRREGSRNNQSAVARGRTYREIRDAHLARRMLSRSR